MAMLNYQRVMVIFGFRYNKLSSSSWGSANWVHARKKAQNCSNHRFSAAKKSLKVSGPKYGPASCSAATSLSASSQRLLPFATMKCGKLSVMAYTNFQRTTVRPWPSWEFFFCEDCHREKTFQTSCLQHPLTDQMHFIIFGPPPGQQRWQQNITHKWRFIAD